MLTIQDLKEGAIVQGASLQEPVKIIKVIPLGTSVQIMGQGLQTNSFHQPIFSPDQLIALQITPEQQPFDGNAQNFRLGVESLRLKLAYEYDPFFSLTIARVDPLPHQLEAVYDYFLKQPRIRFLLADDPGAGKTIMAGLLLKELKVRGLAQRTLIVSPANLTFQWSTRYKQILSRAFPSLYFSRTFDDRNEAFSWGTYIKGADDNEAEALDNLCLLLKKYVFIDDDLDECFALDYHSQMSEYGEWERTGIGRLVREAKPYDRDRNSGNKSSAQTIISWINEEFLPFHPTYLAADLIVSVPPSNLNKPFDLPEFLARGISENWTGGLKFASPAIRKVRSTRPMKECKTISEKIDNIKDAFEVDSEVFRNKSVLIIDDIYQTGFSINEVARTLKITGAKLVLGLVATKTLRDLSEVTL